MLLITKGGYMSHNTNTDRRERIIELRDEEELTPFDIDTIIMEEFDCSRDAARSARKRLNMSQLGKDKVENVGDTKDEVRKNFETREYDFTFYSGTGSGAYIESKFSIPFDEMQDYVVHYTYDGHNRTRKQIAEYAFMKYQRPLTHDYVRRVFRCIDIQKGTVPYAPHMYDENTYDELAEMWHGRDEAMVSAKYYAKRTRKQRALLEKKTAELNNIQDFVRACVEEAEFSGLPDLDIEANNSTPLVKMEGGEIYCDLLISDWHYGMEVDAWFNTFNAEIAQLRVEELLDKFADYYSRNKKRIRQVSIPTLGDMVDGVLGDMRPGQHFEQDVHGMYQMVGCADLLAAFYIGMHKITGSHLKEIDQVVGNHGRSSKDNRGDPQRIPEAALYLIAKEKSRLDHIEWRFNFERPILEFQRGEFHYIMGHGDKKPRKFAQLGVPRARMGKHVIHYCGHLHEVELSGVYNSNFTQVQNGSLCGSDSYAVDQLGYHSTPAQTIAEVSREGVSIKPLFLTEYGSEQI
jgi:hypothetical protein